MKEQDALTWARETALTLHDEQAKWFAQQYKNRENQHGHYESAFLYGRRQVEQHFNSQLAGLPRHARLLDVGCGTGEQMIQVRQMGFHVCGVEPASQMRVIAQSKVSLEAVIDGSVLQLPFSDNTFDLVYAIEVFRYLGSEDNIKGLREVNRVLKPGGTFFGTFVNRYALDGFIVLAGLRRLRHLWFTMPPEAHTEFETPKKLKDSLNLAGFSFSETHGCMLASLRIAYKLGRGVGIMVGKMLEPIDASLSDAPSLRSFSGHLIAIARK